MRALSDAERLHWLRLARTPNIGPVTFQQLIARFGRADEALSALPELSKRAGRIRSLVPPSEADIAGELRAIEAFGANVVCACEPRYPALLRALDPPPPALTIYGDANLLQKPAIAIVGARNASAAGRKMARDMAGALGAAGYVVVSGLARGIDGEAHAASLATGTAAVLGGGIDHIYPPQHQNLYQEISNRGVIVSESRFGHRATARDFPRRNRIITGLAAGVIVVEAAEKSGSLISARTAGEQGREVMAVPGSPLDPRTEGSNRLIRQGAVLVRHAEDVLETLSTLPTLRFEAPPATEFHGEDAEDSPPADEIARVLSALSPNPMPIDEIARTANISAPRCAAILMELELAGDAYTLPGGLAARAV